MGTPVQSLTSPSWNLIHSKVGFHSGLSSCDRGGGRGSPPLPHPTSPRASLPLLAGRSQGGGWSLLNTNFAENRNSTAGGHEKPCFLPRALLLGDCCTQGQGQGRRWDREEGHRHIGPVQILAVLCVQCCKERQLFDAVSPTQEMGDSSEFGGGLKEAI